MKLSKKEKKELKKLEKEDIEQTQKRNVFIRRILIGFASIVIVFGSVYGLTLLTSKSATNYNSSSVLSSQINSSIKPVSNEDITIGNPKAKIVLIEYSDFQCPACANRYPLVKQLLKDYDGKILFVYRFFPLPSHKNAILASEAAYAAKLQGKFVEMHDLLFDKQTDWAQSDNAEEIFSSYAQELNLSLDQFKKDLRSEETYNFVLNKQTEAKNANIQYTPTFFVNGKELVNLNDYQDLKSAIEQELNK